MSQMGEPDVLAKGILTSRPLARRWGLTGNTEHIIFLGIYAMSERTGSDGYFFHI